MKSINERVAAYRRFRGLTQQQMARELGLKATTYSMREREGEISCEMIIKIADLLDVDVKEILYGENPPPQQKKNKSKLENFYIVQPTARELDFLKAIRGLKKKDQQEILDFVQKKLDA